MSSLGIHIAWDAELQGPTRRHRTVVEEATFFRRWHRTSDAQDVRIPINLARQLDSLVSDHERTREKPVEAARRLFEACAQENAGNASTWDPLWCTG